MLKKEKKNVLLFVAYFLADSHVCKQNSDFRGNISFGVLFARERGQIFPCKHGKHKAKRSIL